MSFCIESDLLRFDNEPDTSWQLLLAIVALGTSDESYLVLGLLGCCRDYGIASIRSSHCITRLHSELYCPCLHLASHCEDLQWMCRVQDSHEVCNMFHASLSSSYARYRLQRCRVEVFRFMVWMFVRRQPGPHPSRICLERELSMTCCDMLQIW